MSEINELLLKIVEDVTETRTLVQTVLKQREEDLDDRKNRQEAIDTKFSKIETNLSTATKKLDEALYTWKAIKIVGSSCIAMLVGIITFDWQAVSTNWSNIWQ
jgi:hypothetical protein